VYVHNHERQINSSFGDLTFVHWLVHTHASIVLNLVSHHPHTQKSEVRVRLLSMLFLYFSQFITSTPNLYHFLSERHYYDDRAINDAAILDIWRKAASRTV
jgi:hypothetical protein